MFGASTSLECTPSPRKLSHIKRPRSPSPDLFDSPQSSPSLSFPDSFRKKPNTYYIHNNINNSPIFPSSSSNNITSNLTTQPSKSQVRELFDPKNVSYAQYLDYYLTAPQKRKSQNVPDDCPIFTKKDVESILANFKVDLTDYLSELYTENHLNALQKVQADYKKMQEEYSNTKLNNSNNDYWI